MNSVGWAVDDRQYLYVHYVQITLQCCSLYRFRSMFESRLADREQQAVPFDNEKAQHAVRTGTFAPR